MRAVPCVSMATRRPGCRQGIPFGQKPIRAWTWLTPGATTSAGMMESADLDVPEDGYYIFLVGIDRPGAPVTLGQDLDRSRHIARRTRRGYVLSAAPWPISSSPRVPPSESRLGRPGLTVFQCKEGESGVVEKSPGLVHRAGAFRPGGRTFRCGVSVRPQRRKPCILWRYPPRGDGTVHADHGIQEQLRRQVAIRSVHAVCAGLAAHRCRVSFPAARYSRNSSACLTLPGSKACTCSL